MKVLQRPFMVCSLSSGCVAMKTIILLHNYFVKIIRDYSRAVCAAFDMPFKMATYQEEMAWSGWYHTDRSQQLLQYQRHTFADYINELKALYQEAIGS